METDLIYKEDLYSIKICNTCNISKELNKDNFEFLKDTNKWRNRCRQCSKKYYKLNYNENRNKKQKQKKLKNKIRYKRNSEKILASNKKYRDSNKKKIAEIKKEYYLNNKKKILDYYKQWKRKNDYNNKYYIKNRNKITASRIKRHRDRCKIDKEYQLRTNISKSIGKALKLNDTQKYCSVMNNLPYSIKELKLHLESQFEPWMGWDNWGLYKVGGPRKWHIDHVTPQSKLPYDSMDHPNFKKCWALSNLRPLCAVQNIKKRDK